MLPWISSNSCQLNLLFVQSHQAEIIIVKRLSQGRNNVTRVLVEPRSCNQGRGKNDAFTLSALHCNVRRLDDCVLNLLRSQKDKCKVWVTLHKRIFFYWPESWTLDVPFQKRMRSRSINQVKFDAGMWKRKRWKRLNFCGSGSTLMKEVGSGSELGSESVEKEPEAEAILSKLGASGFSIWQNVTIIIIYNRQPGHGMENGMERKFWYGI